ncbi:hypothetical protein D3C80_1716730 [compost metagenome]
MRGKRPELSKHSKLRCTKAVADNVSLIILHIPECTEAGVRKARRLQHIRMNSEIIGSIFCHFPYPLQQWFERNHTPGLPVCKILKRGYGPKIKLK